MSRESGSTATASNSGAGNGPATTITNEVVKKPDEYPQKSNASEEQVEDDDTDFVLVVNRKKQHSAVHTNSDAYHHYQHHNSRHNNLKGNHNNYQHYRHQQSQYSDGGGGEDYDQGGGSSSHHPRRRKFRDHNNQRQRDNSSGTTKPFKGKGSKQRDRGNHQNQSSQQQNNESTGKENVAEAHQQIPQTSTEQIDKTGNGPSSVNNPPLQSNPPVVKTFSLVVAAGTSSPPSSAHFKPLPPVSTPLPLPQQKRLPNQGPPSQPQQQSFPSPPNNVSSTTTGCASPPQAPAPLVLQDSTNGQSSYDNTNGHLTNRHILLVVQEAECENGQFDEGVSAPSSVVTERSSSIPDTSSLTSEETLDSCGHGQVEFVEAPVPKVNPWVVNRNAAQVIVGGSTSTTPIKKAPLARFPSVDESFPDALGSASPTNKSQMKKVTSPQQQKALPPQQQQPATNSKKQQTGPQQKQLVTQQAQNVVSNSSIPTGNNQAPSSPTTSKGSFAHVAVGSRSSQPTEQSRPSSADDEKAEPTSSNAATLIAPVYYREMTNGFRPGRGRGSYSASASAGRKIPSRTQVLMKVVGENGDNTSSPKSLPSVSNDWPTLGEAVAKVPQSVTRLKSVGEDSGGEMEKENNKESAQVDDVDVVDCSPPMPVMNHSVATPPIPTMKQRPSSTSTSSASSDNDDQGDDGNFDGRNKKQNKPKWVPLDLTAEHQDGGKGSKPSGKGGKGKNGYYSYQNQSQFAPAQRYYGGRGKGKEGMVNGYGHYGYNNDYAEVDRHSRQQPPSSRGIRGGNRGGGSGRPNNHTRRQNSGIHAQRTGSTFNGHTLFNGHHTDHLSLKLLSPTLPPTGPDGAFLEFQPEFTTLTPMYPAVSDGFIMPYVANGYFPIPFSVSPPAGVVVHTGTAEVVEQPQQQQAAGNSTETTTTQAPFVPSDEMGTLVDQVRTQIEYYFSEGNLEKDFYLRRKMDKEGFLPVNLIATFPRVKNMTDEYSIVFNAIKSSDHLELKQDLQIVRTMKNPQKWPILDSSIRGGPLPPTPHENSDHQSAPVSSSAPKPTKMASPSSSSSSSSSNHSININNNHQHSSNYHALSNTTAAESLNPNVPEFVPKSKVELY